MHWISWRLPSAGTWSARKWHSSTCRKQDLCRLSGCRRDSSCACSRLGIAVTGRGFSRALDCSSAFIHCTSKVSKMCSILHHQQRRRRAGRGWGSCDAHLVDLVLAGPAAGGGVQRRKNRRHLPIAPGKQVLADDDAHHLPLGRLACECHMMKVIRQVRTSASAAATCPGHTSGLSRTHACWTRRGRQCFRKSAVSALRKSVIEHHQTMLTHSLPGRPQRTCRTWELQCRAHLL